MGKEVVFQKWRWTEINVTLGLIFVALLRKEWPMTFIAVRCPHCQSDQIVKRGKTARAPSAIYARTPSVPSAVFLLGLLQPRVLARSEANDHRHESQCERGTRYGAIVAYLSQHRCNCPGKRHTQMQRQLSQ